MARKITSPPRNVRPAMLTKSRDEVRSQLISRIAIGQEIKSQVLANHADLEAAREAYRKWDDFNAELLKRVFSTDAFADEYSRYVGFGLMVLGGGPPPLSEKIDEFQSDVQTRIMRLESIAERLDIIDEEPSVSDGRPATKRLPLEQPSTTSTKVFVVHGQDEEAKAVVARFLEKCGLEPVILHEQPNGGRTIIEKFEHEADVGFAVILLTPDDVGGIRDGDSLNAKALQARARQNVILELGFFTGRLGRSRVAALKKGDMELPSDIAGVVWTPLGADEAWKISLARELKGAGYVFDVAKALGI